MISRQKSGTDSIGWMLPLALVLLTAWKALPPLAIAWQDDLYSRGASLSFFIWLLPLVALAYRNHQRQIPPNILWIGISLIFSATGTMSGLRVLDYLALAFALPGLFGMGFDGLLSVAGAGSWLPSFGWFISKVKTGGLEGWERPTIAAFIAVTLILIKSAKKNHMHS